jgi:hypothetical protein
MYDTSYFDQLMRYVYMAGIKRTYYIYKFKRNNEREVGYLCAAARRGQLYVILAVGDPSVVGREEAFQELKTVVESFTLR